MEAFPEGHPIAHSSSVLMECISESAPSQTPLPKPFLIQNNHILMFYESIISLKSLFLSFLQSSLSTKPKSHEV